MHDALLFTIMTWRMKKDIKNILVVFFIVLTLFLLFPVFSVFQIFAMRVGYFENEMTEFNQLFTE